MKTIDVDDAALGEAAKALRPGEMLTLTRDGAPFAAVVGLAVGEAPPPVRERRPIDALGALEGKLKVPDDFDRMFEEEILEMFGIK